MSFMEEAIVDCAAIGLQVKDATSENDIRKVGEKIHHAFSTYGFCYLKNHGIQTFVDLVSESEIFFKSPPEDKELLKKATARLFGWVKPGTEKFNKEGTSADLREAFQYNPGHQDHLVIQNTAFDDSLKAAFSEAKTLSNRLLVCLSAGFGLESSFFANAHLKMGQSGSTSTLRVNFYPPLPESNAITPDGIRFSEHHDYGTFSLVKVYPENDEGLEAKVLGSEGFVTIKSVPGTIVLMPGLLLQRWAADNIKALLHRVMMPDKDVQQKKARFSVVYFVQPDDDFVVKPLDGSNKYEPITGKEFLDTTFQTKVDKED